jgi:hypothetical protein
VIFCKLENCASSSSYFGATARCGLWPVEQYLSIFPYLSPTLSVFSLPALEDLFLLLLSILSWVTVVHLVGFIIEIFYLLFNLKIRI